MCFLGSVTELTLFYMQRDSSTVNNNKTIQPVRNGPDRRNKEVTSTTENGKIDSKPCPINEHTPLIASKASKLVAKQKKSRLSMI